MPQTLKVIPGLGQIRLVGSPSGSPQGQLHFEVIMTSENGKQIILDALKQIDRVRQHTVLFTRKGFRVAISFNGVPESKWDKLKARTVDDIMSAMHRVAAQTTQQPQAATPLVR